jgi:hypothetical protein
LRGLCEDAGDEAVGKLPEGAVNLVFELGEGSRILCESFGPGLLLDRELLLDLSQSLGGFRDIRSGLRVVSETHAKSFRVKQLLLRQNTFSGHQWHHFMGMDPIASGEGGC